MVAINAFGVGAVVSVISAILMSSAQSSGDFGLFLLIIFAVATVGAALLLFRVYIPMDFILWRRKSEDSRRKTIEALSFGAAAPTVASSSSYKRSLFQNERKAAPPRDADADMEQTSFRVTPPAEAPPALDDIPQEEGEETPEDEQADAQSEEGQTGNEDAEDADLLAPYRDRLSAYTKKVMDALTEERPQLQAFERFGANLFIGGAAGGLAEHFSLSDAMKADILQSALESIGTNAAAAKAFCERLDASAQRPRFRKLMDAGHAAITAELNETKSRQPPLTELIKEWSERTEETTDSKQVTFLLTDIVGSTALTSKLGNSGAQRIVRAHNTIVCTAIKDYKGTEVKHTGDGMLTTFPDPAAAARAAIEIQQAVAEFVADNPDAPLELRIGLHAGNAGFEDGEYFGEPLLALGGICDAAEDGQIYCSGAIQAKCPSPAFTLDDIGEQSVKRVEGPINLFRLSWKPKARAPKGELEYRQIGTRPTPPN